jgi:hypothetical protein
VASGVGGESVAEDGIASETEATQQAAGGQQVLQQILEVSSDPPGLEVAIEGRPTGQVTPLRVPLEGIEGSRIYLELLRGGNPVASKELLLHPAMDKAWFVELESGPEEKLKEIIVQTFTVSSRPAGARVRLNGEAVDGATPLEIDLESETRYTLDIALEGHDPVSFPFSLADLSADQRDSGVLHFPLVASTPPAVLVVKSSYPLTIRSGRRSWQVADGREVPIPPGRHDLTLEAPQVFYRDQRSLELASGQRQDLVVPPAVQVTVAATPSNCRIEIDGRDAGYVPSTVSLVVGEHEFAFFWDSLGVSHRETRNIGLASKRIFVAAPNER